MRLHFAFLTAALILSTGCSNSPSGGAIATVSSTRSYNGTASVGDFLTITVDATAATITYANLTNGESGTVPYTVNADGTYALHDPQGNLIAAYEVPNYAMEIQAANSGPNRDTPALITAVDAGKISLSTFSGGAYNYMQFRTAAGGVEVGSVSVGMNGMAVNSSYWPFGALSGVNGGQSPFNSGSIDLTAAVEGSSGTYLTNTNGTETDYIFGTANGVFAVDTPQGAILGMLKASGKDFDSSYAGTYKAIYYQKTGASTGAGNVETGNPSLGTATLVVDAAGHIALTDAQSNVMAEGTLVAVADAAYLYGSAGELSDPCYGVFTVRISTGSVQQDVFVSFLNRSAIFSSFSAALPATPSETYDYFYGVGLATQ